MLLSIATDLPISSCAGLGQNGDTSASEKIVRWPGPESLFLSKYPARVKAVVPVCSFLVLTSALCWVLSQPLLSQPIEEAQKQRPQAASSWKMNSDTGALLRSVAVTTPRSSSPASFVSILPENAASESIGQTRSGISFASLVLRSLCHTLCSDSNSGRTQLAALSLISQSPDALN
jgi:hypothetical protein